MRIVDFRNVYFQQPLSASCLWSLNGTCHVGKTQHVLEKEQTPLLAEAGTVACGYILCMMPLLTHKSCSQALPMPYSAHGGEGVKLHTVLVHEARNVVKQPQPPSHFLEASGDAESTVSLAGQEAPSVAMTPVDTNYFVFSFAVNTAPLALDINKMLDSVKCVLVGDSAVGKTSLLVRFTSETFPDDYRPTVYENTGVDVFMDGVQISLGLWDTSGSDAFKGIRPLSYQQADVVLMCYSVANHNSFLNLRNKWISEIRSHLPRIPVLVVATQTDQRDVGPYSSSCISPIDGKRLAQDVRAKGYLECSALSNRGVQQVFEYAVRTAVNQAKRQNRRKLFSINDLDSSSPVVCGGNNAGLLRSPVKLLQADLSMSLVRQKIITTKLPCVFSGTEEMLLRTPLTCITGNCKQSWPCLSQ
ncbi:hypothetical protein IHE44_0012975 [Lamprotornis superbus]|uniref:Rho-related GTP-binding protein RhoH n=1 Tax=Lamprotornis superbus TaxID=245042 RepID=A0A835TWD5_9PASS|nr:hypothetical protein IHE44_0012975 [Lamprotornis superbus]